MPEVVKKQYCHALLVLHPDLAMGQPHTLLPEMALPEPSDACHGGNGLVWACHHSCSNVSLPSVVPEEVLCCKLFLTASRGGGP